MTAPAAPVATMALDEARSAWHRANVRERLHAERCRLIRLGSRCGTCLDLEAAQNVAALRMEQVRLLAGRAS